MKRQHKDTMFRGWFKIPQNFLHLLKHCKGDTTLTTDDIELFDLESVVIIRGRRNDVSFITKDNRLIILIEHQSSLNPNMAFRLFLYYMELLHLWIKSNSEINLYGNSKIENFPLPEFYVAYNGEKPLEEEFSTFKLDYGGVKVEVEVKILDIHFENLEDTRPDNALAGYSFFYKVFDDGLQAGLSNEEAFVKAREESMSRGYLKDFINKEEFIMDYKDHLFDYDIQLRLQGEARGKAKEAEENILLAMKYDSSNALIEEIAKKANISAARLDELRASTETKDTGVA
ncbi:MAG: Rpn family recombination-promoting nuclease/putative transposase [Defluviitaleaceae bacterium]|nr:Rpn family recombination-promoting nuclease/putative transposase [Defluviitaleaceae bacterium]